MSKVLTSKSEDFSKWYNDLVIKAELADHSGVRGCMVIKPYGFSLWENMQRILDSQLKDTGHSNAYFPLLIPKSYFTKEAEHIKGFAKECAIVTHYRLKSVPGQKELVVDPESKLEEELIIRPTSETIIWNTYKNWIQSYRDLPLLINQWANVVRWEMRTRFFLRTTEFFWQEGHTAHATQEEAIQEAELIHELYKNFIQDYLAIPIIKGTKTESERFAGALTTYTIESLMQDGKALQMGTTHFLGQNFAKAFDVKYSTKEGGLEYVWATSWGVSSRLIGALIMAHSDDEGLIIPPKIAPDQVVIIPIIRNDEGSSTVLEKADSLKKTLAEKNIRVKLDDDDAHTPGWKFAEYELKGVPIRIAIGPKDIANGTVEVVRRDTGEKLSIPVDGITETISDMLDKIQQNIFDKASKFKESMTTHVNTYDEFKKIIKDKGGFVWAHWDGTKETEEKISAETKATIRCIPLNGELKEGKCIYSGKPSKQAVLFATAY